MTKLPYNPPQLPVKLDVGQFAHELAEAEYSLGLLEGSQRKLHNPSLLIAPLTAKEAAVSSKIEGTQSTASDVFIYEAKGETQKPDTAEVANYRRAMLYAIKELKAGRVISLHFIKQLHDLLLNGVRHKGSIGKFRESQVWIAEKAGDPIESAIYVPPEFIHINSYMENILTFIADSRINTLTKAALVHYQFEAVHPFEDGNGRIGRLLIPVLLCHKSKLTIPILYLSGFFEKNREDYIKSLHKVDENQSYEEWISFFLKAITIQAHETQALIDRIYELHDELRNAYEKLKSPYIIPVIELMFKSPVFTIPTLMRVTKATRLTCSTLVTQLIKDNYVVKLKSRSGRLNLFAFHKLLKIIR
jgi:Fic family protein